jgi:hypothetical protein
MDQLQKVSVEQMQVSRDTIEITCGVTGQCRDSDNDVNQYDAREYSQRIHGLSI